MRMVREGLDLRRTSPNFRIAANSGRLARWSYSAYGTPCALLPNMYHLDDAHPKRERYSGGTLRIGAFGATRALKNLMTAGGAALQIANELRVDLEFWISSGRNEGGGSVVDAVRQMMTGLPHVKLVENGWQTWPQFRRTVRHMHLLLQPSYTESFNVVTADGIAEGVPSVVSDAIEWAPDNWKAPVDDAGGMAKGRTQTSRAAEEPPRQGTDCPENAQQKSSQRLVRLPRFVASSNQHQMQIHHVRSGRTGNDQIAQIFKEMVRVVIRERLVAR